jgi:hypothetical protein
MTRAEEYRQYAAECIRVAQQMQNPADKTMLLDMAQKWRALAAKAESEQRPSDVTPRLYPKARHSGPGIIPLCHPRAREGHVAAGGAR